MNQYLVDYTVRNITTGDEEDIRVLELETEEFDGFPEQVRDDIRNLIGLIAWQWHAGQPIAADWLIAQDQILKLLLPYITDRALYDSDYEAWENNVLEGTYDAPVQS
jgi:hypothetical protein